MRMRRKKIMMGMGRVMGNKEKEHQEEDADEKNDAA